MADDELTRNSSTISFEQRFNCLICWAPNLRMIYGSCQHRLCENCLYDEQGNRRAGLERCPTCQRENAFPASRPDIPEDNIEIQVQLGVKKCPNSRCGLQMWYWEIPDHLEKCQFLAKSHSKAKKRKTMDDSSSGLEIKTPMKLRSKTRKPAELVCDKVMGRMKTRTMCTRDKLRPRSGKNKNHTK